MPTYQTVLEKEESMFLFDAIEGIKCDIVSKNAERKMIRAEKEMDPDVTIGDVRKVIAAYKYAEEKGCDFGVAIDKFFKTSKLTTGHMQAALKVLDEAGVPVSRQQLLVNMYGVISVSPGDDNILILRDAGFSDTDILDMQSWFMHNSETVKKLSEIVESEMPGEEWIPKAI